MDNFEKYSKFVSKYCIELNFSVVIIWKSLAKSIKKNLAANEDLDTAPSLKGCIATKKIKNIVLWTVVC
uniref:Uncharacterized protein n=1 Tax=Arundo donax TaxID=35708 RepID=A0A0A8Y793_ARUDO